MLRTVYRLARNCHGAPGGNYFILLVLTDGVINDNDETREAIVNVSSAMHRFLPPADIGARCDRARPEVL